MVNELSHHSTTQAHPMISDADKARFWTLVVKTQSCWIWTGRARHRYGRFHVNGEEEAAHRVAWELAGGKIPYGQCVLHRCDNPPCVNPVHLFLGTQADNLRDCASKGRNVQSKKTHCPSGHPYDADNTIIVQYRGKRKRYCRKCRNARSDAYRKSLVP